MLNSGGDCAGLNAVILAVIYHAIQAYGWQVIGIEDGTLGLMKRPPCQRDPRRHHEQGDPFGPSMPDGSLGGRSQNFFFEWLQTL